MAIITNTLRSVQVTATNTTTVAAGVALPDNAHTVIIYNPDATNSVYMAEAAPSGSAIGVAVATIIPASSTLTLGIGTITMRAAPTAAFGFSTSAGSIALTVTYICTNTI